MYAGQFVETGSVRDVLRQATHPYTEGLFAANLHGAQKGQRLDAIPGAPPALHEPPKACSFAPRCAIRQPRCTEAAAGVNARGRPLRALRRRRSQEPRSGGGVGARKHWWCPDRHGLSGAGGLSDRA